MKSSKIRFRWQGGWKGPTTLCGKHGPDVAEKFLRVPAEEPGGLPIHVDAAPVLVERDETVTETLEESMSCGCSGSWSLESVGRGPDDGPCDAGPPEAGSAWNASSVEEQPVSSVGIRGLGFRSLSETEAS